MESDYTHRSIAVGDVDLHLVETGKSDAPPVVFLHGFPEFWYGWHRQLEPIARAGHRAIAPDQRGYNESDKPKAAADYRLDRLADDVVGLIDALDLESVHLVGHDWGGVVAWWLGLARPDRIDRLAILNAPHPKTFRRHLTSRPAQMLKSWYMYLFQLPALPEQLLGAGNGIVATRMLKATSRAGAFAPGELSTYREAWSKPGAWQGMLNWYRAMFRHPPDPPENWRVEVPTLVVWGEQDQALDADLAAASLEWCENGDLEYLSDATHWVQHEYAAGVNRMLVNFFDEH